MACRIPLKKADANERFLLKMQPQGNTVHDEEESKGTVGYPRQQLESQKAEEEKEIAECF